MTIEELRVYARLLGDGHGWHHSARVQAEIQARLASALVAFQESSETASRRLAWLTWTLVALTAVIVALTVVLVLRELEWL